MVLIFWALSLELGKNMFKLNQSHFVMVNTPLDQFQIKDIICIHGPILGNINICLTNIAIYLLLSCLISFAFFILTSTTEKLIFTYWSLFKETIYDTVNGIVISQINNKGQMFFPFIFSLFIFILSNNLIGMIPYSFASTSHFVMTFALSFSVVLGATILGLQKHGIKFFSLFVPAGCPLILLPLLVLIEFISYLARNVSLGLRLAANILSGHMLLNILSTFTFNIITSGPLLCLIGLIPLLFIIVFSGLELAIAFIQAQVFVVLSSSYIKDGLSLH